MSWSLNVTGRAGTVATVIKDKFAQTGGCPKGSAEEAAKDAVGAVCETLAKSLPPDSVVRISAQGSAWNMPDGSAKSQHCEFKFTHVGDFLEAMPESSTPAT